jgi:hypothetical protein
MIVKEEYALGGRPPGLPLQLKKQAVTATSGRLANQIGE